MITYESTFKCKHFETAVAYLCFPKLTWRFWKTDPISVSGVTTGVHRTELNFATSRSDPDSGPTHTGASEKDGGLVNSMPTNPNDGSGRRVVTTTFSACTRSGLTKALMERTSRSGNKHSRVCVCGPSNHSGQVRAQLAHCNNILCIAGGVGITVLHAFFAALIEKFPQVAVAATDAELDVTERLAEMDMA